MALRWEYIELLVQGDYRVLLLKMAGDRVLLSLLFAVSCLCGSCIALIPLRKVEDVPESIFKVALRWIKHEKCRIIIFHAFCDFGAIPQPSRTWLP